MWIKRQAIHYCKIPRGSSYMHGDIWECDDCKVRWEFYINWAGEGWSKTIKAPSPQLN